MSFEAVAWALEDAPMLRTERGKADTTARFVLVALAERADSQGRRAHPSLLDIQYRTGFDRSTVQRGLRRLEAAGLIVKTDVVHGCACWLLVMDQRRPDGDREALEAEEAAEKDKATERKRRSRERSVTHSTPVTVTHSTPATEPDVTGVTPSGHALKVRDIGDVTHFTPGGHALNAALTTHEPPKELTTQEPTPPASPVPPKGGRDARGTRLPDDFAVTPDMKAWARQNTPLCGTTDHDAFCDYWQSTPGAKGRKLDWVKTWKNWMRREQERRATQRARGAPPPGPRMATADQRYAEIQALKAEITGNGAPHANVIQGELS